MTRVGYVLKMFPRLSETFVLHELLELERQGTDLSVYSLMYPNDGKFHGRLSELRATAAYVPSQKPEAIWAGLQRLPREFHTPPDCWQAASDFVQSFDTPRPLEFLLRALTIAALARRDGVERLHAHFATIASRMAATVHLLTGLPFSFTAHAKDIFRANVDPRLLVRLTELAEVVVTVSEYNRDYIGKRYPSADLRKIRVLYNGVDLRVLRPPAKSRANGTFDVISVGRLVPKKGFDHLIEAAGLLVRRGVPLRVTIVGDGEERERLEQLVRERGLGGVVTLAGAQPHDVVLRRMREASIVALACVADGDGNMDALPTVLLEALALDRPVVSTTLTGVPEIVDAQTGELCPPGDAVQLAAALERMIERIRAGEPRRGVCRARAEQRFDLARNVAELRGLLCGNGALA